MKVAILTETPEDAGAPGRHRRYRTLYAWLSRSAEVENIHLFDHPGQSLMTRTVTALRWRGSSTADGYVVCGLASPHMLLLAIRLARRNRVIFDACDSWLLQHRARLAQGGASAFISLVGAAITAMSPRLTAISYITDRDEQADRRLSRRQRRVVIPQAEDDSLSSLPPVGIPLTRITVSADANSFHTRSGLNDFLPALARTAAELGLDVDVFGNIEEGDVPPGARVRGWAPELRSLYEGSTAVFVTNLSGSGVPNKVIEANAAGRPVILHSSLDYLNAQIRVPAYWFSSVHDIGDALRRCVSAAEYRVATTRTQPRADLPPARIVFGD